MTKQSLFALSFGFAVAIFATVANAAQANNCAPREAVIERLAERYGETRRSMALDASNHIVEVFASTATGTWTITVTRPNGLTCLVAAGRAFEAITPEAQSGERA